MWQNGCAFVVLVQVVCGIGSCELRSRHNCWRRQCYSGVLVVAGENDRVLPAAEVTSNAALVAHLIKVVLSRYRRLAVCNDARRSVLRRASVEEKEQVLGIVWRIDVREGADERSAKCPRTFVDDDMEAELRYFERRQPQGSKRVHVMREEDGWADELTMMEDLFGMHPPRELPVGLPI